MNKLLKLFTGLLAVLIGVIVAKKLGTLEGGILFVGALSNYGEVFARNCLRKFYARAVTPAITNSDYEGSIKGLGERLNILSFLTDINISDYTVGSDMGVQHPADSEDQLIINQKKYYDFDIDRVDREFTYVEDEDSTLIENASRALEKVIDTFVLNFTDSVKCGHRVGSDHIIAIGSFSSLSAAGAYVTDMGTGIDSSTIVGKGLYIDKLSTSPSMGWYRISAFTDSSHLTITNWDDSAYASGAKSSDYSAVTIEAAGAVQVTASTIYGYICDLATDLDNDEIPDTGRVLVCPAWFKNLLVQASQLQPDIALYHEETVVNGKVGRVAGFDIHLSVGTRIATSAGADGVTGYEVLACHTGFITFAHKWSESRVVDSEKQFAKLYQGLNLYGAKVAVERRKAGAMLYCKQ